MRSFIAAIILLALICALIFFDCAHILKTANELLTLINENCSIYTFKEKWEKSREKLALSINHDSIFKIDTLTESALFFESKKSKFDYDLSLILIKETLNEIIHFEKFSLANLF